MNTNMKLRITEIQRFCMHDGPGIRTTVFLKGCPLRCEWCHNPETQKSGADLLFYPGKCIGCGGCQAVCASGVHIIKEAHFMEREKCVLCGKCANICPTGALEFCGKDLSIEEILAVVEKDRAFYGEQGGVTISGGEPLMQKEASIALLRACKERGLPTAVETSGYVDEDTLRTAVPLVDLFLWDIKDTDDTRHQKYTGVSHQKIRKNLALADALGAKIRLRCILVSGVNTIETHYKHIAEIALSLSACEGVELLPYHAYGGTKALFLGGEDNGKAEWIPSSAQIAQAKAVLEAEGVFVF